MDTQKSKKQIWMEQLEVEGKRKKLNKKNLNAVLFPYIRREKGLSTGNPNLRWWVIWGVNYAGREIEVRCKSRDECLENLATLNGFTVE